MKLTFFVFEVDHNNGTKFAFANAIRTGEDLAVFFRRYNPVACHICASMTEAEKIAYEINNGGI